MSFVITRVRPGYNSGLLLDFLWEHNFDFDVGKKYEELAPWATIQECKTAEPDSDCDEPATSVGFVSAHEVQEENKPPVDAQPGGSEDTFDRNNNRAEVENPTNEGHRREITPRGSHCGEVIGMEESRKPAGGGGDMDHVVDDEDVGLNPDDGHNLETSVKAELWNDGESLAVGIGSPRHVMKEEEIEDEAHNDDGPLCGIVESAPTEDRYANSTVQDGGCEEGVGLGGVEKTGDQGQIHFGDAEDTGLSPLDGNGAVKTEPWEEESIVAWHESPVKRLTPPKKEVVHVAVAENVPSSGGFRFLRFEESEGDRVEDDPAAKARIPLGESGSPSLPEGTGCDKENTTQIVKNIEAGGADQPSEETVERRKRVLTLDEAEGELEGVAEERCCPEEEGPVPKKRKSLSMDDTVTQEGGRSTGDPGMPDHGDTTQLDTMPVDSFFNWLGIHQLVDGGGQLNEANAEPGVVHVSTDEGESGDKEEKTMVEAPNRRKTRLMDESVVQEGADTTGDSGVPDDGDTNLDAMSVNSFVNWMQGDHQLADGGVDGTNVQPEAVHVSTGEDDDEEEEELMAKRLKNIEWTCADCGLVLPSMKMLTKHMKTHPGRPTYRCSKCDLRFGGADAFKWHVMHQHGNEKYSCSVCGRCFRSKDKHRYHMAQHQRSSMFNLPPHYKW